MATTLTGMTTQTILHRFFPAVYLVLVALLGSLAGWLAAIILGFRLVSPPARVSVGTSPEQVASVRIRPLGDYQIILDRDIFNPEGGAAAKLTGSTPTAVPTSSASAASSEKKEKTAPVLPKNLALIGTVAAGANSLAVLQQGRETHVYRLGEEIAKGISVKEILRDTVVLAFSDGSRQTLSIAGKKQATSGAKAAPPASRNAGVPNHSEIKKVGDNKYIIPREVAAQARNNVGELMKQARMEPHLVHGQTDGFVVRMIRPRSLLGQLGLRLGDVVVAINNVPLNSPEKALQVFQQLREAQNIKVDLLRRGQPLTLEIDTE